MGYILAVWGAELESPLERLVQKNWQGCLIDDIIIYSNFGFNIFGVADLQGGGAKIFIFP